MIDRVLHHLHAQPAEVRQSQPEALQLAFALDAQRVRGKDQRNYAQLLIHARSRLWRPRPDRARSGGSRLDAGRDALQSLSALLSEQDE